MALGNKQVDPGLLTKEGRGVKNGIPYGEQLLKEQQEVHEMYAARPDAEAKLRAQTRKALGR